jgi:hypothetical protein
MHLLKRDFTFISIDEKGNEHIVQFAIEGWITDLASFLTNSNSIYT